jgi:hypothetical protein
MHFTERFFNLMHYALDSSARNSAESWDNIARTITSLIGQAENKSLPPGFSEPDQDNCLTPILLWIDETFLNSKRPDALKWYNYSLQHQYFHTNQGGELFYQHLKELLVSRSELIDTPTVPESSDISEITDPLGYLLSLWIDPGQGPDPLESQLDSFALCLVLGYKGRLINDAPEKAAELRELARKQLSYWSVTDQTGPVRRAKKFHFWRFISEMWRNNGWILVHLLTPAAITLFLWIHFMIITNSIPF